MGLVRYLLALLLLLIPFVSYSADIDCDNATLQSAIDAAADGATITCKAGAFTWTASPTIPDTKGLTITGKGKTTESGTVINHAGKPLIIYTKAANSGTDISGFRFVKSAVGNSVVIYNNDNPPNYNADPEFRIHGNYFDDNTYTGYSLFVSSYVYGLIDDNDFIDFGNCGIAIAYAAGNSPAQIDGDVGAWAWSQAQSIGSNKAVYIENNTFSTTSTTPNDAINSWNGAKYVARYNNVTNSNVVTHSGCTGGRYQPIWTEMYNNIIDVSTNYGQAWFRTSSGVAWNNYFPSSPSWNTPVKVDNERSYMTNCSTTYLAVNLPCDGTRAFDENTESMTGWRCLGQVGYGPLQTSITEGVVTYGMDLGYVFAGLFAWDNKKGVARTATNLVLNGTNATQALHIVFGRELFNAENMTVGGAKPETCSFDVDTGRDIYIDTTDADNPVIWQCSATNTWTQHWTPYTCPHPLAGAGECTATAGKGGYVLGGEPPIYTASSSVVNSAGGTVSASVSVESGNTAIFTYEAFNGWKFKEWAGTCGGSGTTTYTTNAISGDCTVTAEFTEITLFP